jgi:hypothetical protein
VYLVILAILLPFSLKMMPGFALRRMLLENLPQGRVEREIADSIDFIVERVSSRRSETLRRQEGCEGV